MVTWPRRVCAVAHRRSRACCTRPSRPRLLNSPLTTPPPFRARRSRQGAAPETRYLLRTPCHHGRRLTLRCRGNPAAGRAGHGIGAAQPHAHQRVLLCPGVSHLYFSLPSDAVNSCFAHLREHLPTRVRHWRPESEIRLATMPIITAMLCRRARLVPNQESGSRWFLCFGSDASRQGGAFKVRKRALPRFSRPARIAVPPVLASIARVYRDLPLGVCLLTHIASRRHHAGEGRGRLRNHREPPYRVRQNSRNG